MERIKRFILSFLIVISGTSACSTEVFASSNKTAKIKKQKNKKNKKNKKKAFKKSKKIRKLKKNKNIKKIRINYRSLNLTVGQSKKLKLMNIRKQKSRKTNWSVSDRKIASINKNGKIKAIKAGTVKAFAKNGKTKYSCRIIIRSKKRPKIQKIHFNAGDIIIDQQKFISHYDKSKMDYIYSQIMNFTDDIDISGLGYTLDPNNMEQTIETCDLRTSYTLMMLEHPELIQIDQEFTAIANTETGLITHLQPVYVMKSEEYAQKYNEMETAVNDVAVKISKKKKTKDKIIEADKIIRKKTKYSTKTPDNNSVYGSLVKNSACCMGYSRTFKLCMDRMKIPCTFEMTDDHVWNRVMLNGKWLVVDVTFDDAGDNASFLKETHESPDIEILGIE